MKKTYALVGASAAIGAAVGPLLRLRHHYLSWRVGFLTRAVIIAIVLVNIRLVKDAVTRARANRSGRRPASIVGMGGVVFGILVWQEGGAPSDSLMAVGAVGCGSSSGGSGGESTQGTAALLDPDLFKIANFHVGTA